MTFRQIQKTNFRKLSDLLEFLGFSKESLERVHTASNFPLNVPRRLAEKMERNSPDDPIFRQFVPLLEETIVTPGYSLDPVEDGQAITACRLLQKYNGRALIVTTGACAMHCRYCFRQNFNYGGDALFSAELKAIAQDTSLHEVILSGGDPLSLSNKVLKELIQNIASIDHIELLRFHTRFLIGIPERIESEFLAMIKACPLQVVVVIHCNHPRELDRDVLEACGRLKEAGAMMLNQSVLLKGVNDDVATLKKLSLKLVQGGILPYYLHSLDPVQGAAHFAVDKEEGLRLIEALKGQLPGYAVPKYVAEIPNKPNKMDVLHTIQGRKSENLEPLLK